MPGSGYREVVQMLQDRDQRLWQGRWLDRHHDHAIVLMDLAWRTAKGCGLASGEDKPEWWSLTFEEQEALRLHEYQLPAELGSGAGVVSLRMAGHRRG